MTPADTEPSLVAKVLAVHEALLAGGVEHAFGGALALAYWTADPRTTADIDVNISVAAAGAGPVLDALPPGIAIPSEALRRIAADDQIRLRWGRTPIDLFFRVTSFHDGIADRSLNRPFAGRLLPFVCADDLAVLKCLFDRPKDWVDITAMRDAGSLTLPAVIERVAMIVGGEDARTDRLRQLE